MKIFSVAVLHLLILCQFSRGRSFSLPSKRTQKLGKEIQSDDVPDELHGNVAKSALLDSTPQISSGIQRREPVANLCTERTSSLQSYEDKDIARTITEPAEEFPWFFLLSGSANCGGTLISPTMILTAAHCFDKEPPLLNEISKMQCYRPESCIAYRPYNATDQYEVKVVFLAPNYQQEGAKNRYRWDMAIVILKRPVYNRPNVPCFNQSDEPAPGDKCWAIAKGLIVNVKVSVCPGERNNIISKIFHLCAAQAQREGDSGGPVVCKNQSAGGYYIAGVMSESVDGTKSGLLTNMMRKEISDWVLDFMKTDEGAISGDYLEAFCNIM